MFSAFYEVPDTPDRIRTCDLRVRNALLYPAELRGRLGCNALFEFTLLAVRLEDRLGPAIGDVGVVETCYLGK